jgi:hypothetical protein
MGQGAEQGGGNADGAPIPDLSSIEHFEQITYRTESGRKAPQHVYAARDNGKLWHLSHDAVLAYFLQDRPEDERERLLADTPLQEYRRNYDSTVSTAEEARMESERRRHAEARLLHRTKGLLLRTGSVVAALPSRLSETYRSPDKRKRAIAYTAGGAVVGALIGYGIYRFGFAGSPSMGHALRPGGTIPYPSVPPVTHAASPPATAIPHIPGRNCPPPGAEHCMPPPVGSRHEDGPTVHLGPYDTHTGAGTIWYAVQHYAARLGYHHLRPHQVWLLTQHTLRLNHISWRGARHLSVQAPVHMLPRQELKQLLP